MNKVRPKHLALHKIKLPLSGYVSILHRISGAVFVPCPSSLLLLLDQSLRSIETYTNLTEWLSNPLLKLVLLALMWAFLHHFCAGLRYLAIDLHLLPDLASARAASMWVMVVSLALTVVLGSEVMVNRIVTGAHYGLRDWLVQRITAAVMAVYVLFIAIFLLRQASFGYDIWIGLFSGNVMRTFSMLFLLSLFYHAWVGVRDIVMDYVKLAGIRLLMHVLVILALMLYFIWSVQVLWGL